jgi:2-alkenal reductase
MTNKIIIGILVLLVVIAGGIGYYSFTLNEQVDRLSERLTAFETLQEARSRTLSDDLASLHTEMQSSINDVESQVAGARTGIDTLGKDLVMAEDRITSLEKGVGNLDERITSAVVQMSHSAIDASAVYEKVIRATVRVSDGQSIIGSGFIYDNQGHVITAYHVINGLSPIYIELDNGQVSRAVITGSSSFSDIAVLKLEDSPSIEPVTLADSAKVSIGEPVIAIGSPLNMRDTLTSGIISQVNRFTNYGNDSNWVANLLQFDAPVNSGNSGGPLVNASGEVIGVVVARIEAGEGDGIYYAVSSNKARRVAEAIIASGSFPYPWVGVGISDLTPRIAEQRTLTTTNGVLVSEVYSDGPAQAAGIQTDDIILSIDGILVRDSAELTSYLGEYKSPGDQVVIEVLRGTNGLRLTFEIGTREQ